MIKVDEHSPAQVINKRQFDMFNEQNIMMDQTPTPLVYEERR